MNTHTHNMNRNIATTYRKKGIGFSDYMNRLTNLLKLRSSRGYGSAKSAYSYYIRNI